MAYEHKYFGKSTTNKFIIGLDHFIRKIFKNDFDETSDHHSNKDLMFAYMITNYPAKFQNNEFGSGINSHNAYQIETSKFIRSGMR